MENKISRYDSGVPDETNIYTPYQVVDDQPGLIHLATSARRKKLFVFVYNLMPAVIICLIPGLFIFNDQGLPPAFLVVMTTAAVTVAAILFFKKLIYEVVITGSNVEITGVQHLKKYRRIVDLQDVDSIYLEVYRGKGGGAFFKLCTKKDRKIEFINIPILFMNRRNLRAICTRLREITQRSVTGDSLATKMMN